MFGSVECRDVHEDFKSVPVTIMFISTLIEYIEIVPGDKASR